MIQDDQENSRRLLSQPETASSLSGSGDGGSASSDAGFNHLLELLDAEESRPAAAQGTVYTLEQPPSHQEPPGEFTRIFTQLPTPRSEPPAILTKTAPPSVIPAASRTVGEFTQFFQASGPRPDPVAPDATAVLPQQAKTPVIPAQPTQPIAPVPLPDLQVSAPAAAHGFEPAFAPSVAVSAAPRNTSPTTEPDSLTAFLQNAGRSPAPGATPGPPAGQTNPTPAPAVAMPVKNSSSSGGFTELLRTLEASRPDDTEPASAHSRQAPISLQDENAFLPSTFPPARPFAAPAATSALAPPSFAATNPQPQSGASNPGEFTQLLQTLQTPRNQPAAVSSQSGAESPFFGDAHVSSGGPSEFTRIIQGSAARAVQAPVASFAPAPQNSGAAVGLPVAALQVPKPPAPPTGEVKTKLQAMLPWLLAANAALLLLLVTLAIMFLRQKQ